MKYLHSMVRVSDLEDSLDFYCNKMGLYEVNRFESIEGRFTLIFLSVDSELDFNKSNDKPLIELTYNWDQTVYNKGDNFGHLAFSVENIYDFCERLIESGVVIKRPPRDGHMAFVSSPDDISIEIIQEGERLVPIEPWLSMKNQGEW
ncbi:VOC family protein [Vibrio splendidus]|uniref:VOC family protein n=1 Tax=Vibrio splendidus TaxID=29497 RepID=UPI000E3296BF|nr:VOC family protein [Vibrio splendidus]